MGIGFELTLNPCSQNLTMLYMNILIHKNLIIFSMHHNDMNYKTKKKETLQYIVGVAMLCCVVLESCHYKLMGRHGKLNDYLCTSYQCPIPIHSICFSVLLSHVFLCLYKKLMDPNSPTLLGVRVILTSILTPFKILIILPKVFAKVMLRKIGTLVLAC